MPHLRNEVVDEEVEKKWREDSASSNARIHLGFSE